MDPWFYGPSSRRRAVWREGMLKAGAKQNVPPLRLPEVGRKASNSPHPLLKSDYEHGPGKDFLRVCF